MIRWSGYNWISTERWGQIHPNKTVCWYDPGCVSIDEKGYLHLETKYNPKYFDDLKVTSTVGIGLVSCTEKFKFGTFEIEAKLPIGQHLWPAFWMWSWDSWPPEIDVFEAYTEERGTYLSPGIIPTAIWDVQSNLHYGLGDNLKSIKSKKHWWGWKNPAHTYLKYKLEWKPESIKWYYNNSLVRTVTNKTILSELNKTTLNVVLNNSVTDKIDRLVPSKSDFIVKYFNYNPF